MEILDEHPDYVYVGQHVNPSNPKAHYLGTGPEIWRQTDGRLTHWVCGIGTGGTISGVARFLKERDPDVKVIEEEAAHEAT